jgi:WS/DGAT/MGAT family acyltransferase
MSPPKSKRRAALAAKASDAGASAAKQLAAIKDVYAYGLRKVLATISGEPLTGSQPFTAHHSPMNEPLGRSRSYATLSLPLDEMRALGKQYGATLNDMVVTLVDEGVHRYLRETGRPFPHRLVSFCPVSLREKGDLEAATKVTAMYVPMGEHDASIVERVHQVVAAATDAKREMRSMSKDAAMVYAVALLALAQASTASGLGRVTPPIANLVISNVPGADRTMYLHGARLLGMYSASAIAASVGLNVTVSSYDGRMDFGIVGNGATMHSLSSMASHIADAYEELKAATAAGAHRPARKTARRRSGNVARRPSNKAAGWSKPRAAVSPRRKR